MVFGLFEKKSPTIYDLTKELAPRVVKIMPKPQNGRCPLPEGIIQHAPQYRNAREAPRAAWSISKDAVPRDVQLTDVSEFLASDQISKSPTQHGQTLKEFLQASKTTLENSPPPSFTWAEVPRTPKHARILGLQTPMSKRTSSVTLLEAPQTKHSTENSTPDLHPNKRYSNSSSNQIPGFSTGHPPTQISAVHPDIHPPFELPANETPQIRYLSFIVGTQDPNSRYKTQRLFKIRSNLVQNSKVLSKYHSYVPSPRGSKHGPIFALPDVDPQAFDLYLQYQSIDPHSRLRATPEERASWLECWPLVNAYILATTIEDTNFADFMIDILVKKLHNKTCADSDTIKHIFTAQGISSRLKELVVDRCMAAIEEILAQGIEDLPWNFLNMMLHAIFNRFREGDTQNNDECKYHIHGLEGECYKKQFSTNSLITAVGHDAKPDNSSLSESGMKRNSVKAHCNLNSQTKQPATGPLADGQAPKSAPEFLANEHAVHNGVSVNGNLADKIEDAASDGETEIAPTSLMNKPKSYNQEPNIEHMNVSMKKPKNPNTSLPKAQKGPIAEKPKNALQIFTIGTSSPTVTTNGNPEEGPHVEAPDNRSKTPASENRFADPKHISGGEVVNGATQSKKPKGGTNNDDPIALSEVEVGKQKRQDHKCPGAYPESVQSLY